MSSERPKRHGQKPNYNENQEDDDDEDNQYAEDDSDENDDKDDEEDENDDEDVNEDAVKYQLNGNIDYSRSSTDPPLRQSNSANRRNQKSGPQREPKQLKPVSALEDKGLAEIRTKTPFVDKRKAKNGPKKTARPIKKCSHGKRKYNCRECPDGGGSFCEHDIIKFNCSICHPEKRCQHKKLKHSCPDCSRCPHGISQSRNCRDCGARSWCFHGRIKTSCRNCNGSNICPHGRRRYICVECGGSGTCEHGRRRDLCNDCANKKAE